MFPHLSEDDRLIVIVFFLALFFGVFWLWNRRAKKWLEENGKAEPSLNALHWRPGDVEQAPATPLRYSEVEFQEMVARALDEVPKEFDKEWDNVAVTVSTEWPSDEDKQRMSVPKGHVVFGSYSGYSKTRGLSSNASSHVIVIYQPALELCYGSDKERLEQEIRKVVLHELAHHLGMSHQRMKEIGLQ